MSVKLAWFTSLRKKCEKIPMFSSHSKMYVTIFLCLLWYTTSAITNNLSKKILDEFSYPLTLSFLQFGFVSLFCWLAGSSRVRSTGQHFSKIYNDERMSDLPLHENSMDTSYLPVYNQSATSITQIEQVKSEIKWKAITSLFRYERTPITGKTLFLILPIATFQILGHVFSSVSLTRVTVSFVHTIKALSPLFTVVLSRFFLGNTYGLEVWISLIPLTCGVMFACAGELSFNALGFFFSLSACLIFVVQNLFAKKLFRDYHMDKMNLLFVSTLISFTMMAPFWCYSDGYSLLFNRYLPAGVSHVGLGGVSHTTAADLEQYHLPNQSQSLAQSMKKHYYNTSSLNMGTGLDGDTENAYSFIYLTLLFTLNGFSHFMQSVFAFSILNRVSPVTYSVASLVKRVFVIVASILYFGNSITTMNFIGISLSFVGLYCYGKSSEDENKQKTRRRSSDSFPAKNMEIIMYNYSSDVNVTLQAPSRIL